ncbi:MAG: TrmH family RNA methyltransferase [Spirochaetota bacterium]
MSRRDRLIDYLARFVTAERRARMHAVLAERTRYLTVAVEDIYQPHNASAVLRTCDCFGVQDVHIIENRNEYRLNPGVELGTAQWLTLHRYRDGGDNTPAAIDSLRAAGYRVVATTPHTNQVALEQFDLRAGPIALLFGNELDGLSDTALEAADEHLVIPMYGFVESFNISVSAAIVLHHLAHSLRTSDLDYRLDEEERRDIELAWLRSSITRVEALEREFAEEQP